MLSPIRRATFIPARTSGIPDCFLVPGREDAPVLVAIHGISRNAAEIASRFAAHPAFAGVTIVAPLFDRERFGKYQQLLARREGETPSDLALFRLLDRLRASHAIPQGRFALFGFSGGAQMAHRLAMLHPDRVSRLCAVSAGWYMMPDRGIDYPYGLGGELPAPLPGNGFLSVPMQVIVGKLDTRIDEAVRQDPAIVERQGRNRLQRARAYVRAMTEAARDEGLACDVTLTVLEAGIHDFGECVREAGLIDRVASALLA